MGFPLSRALHAAPALEGGDAAVIEAENASFTYQSAPSPALQDVTLTVQPGECVVLCGRSGCGKTTFTHLLNGLSPEFYPGTLTGRCTAAGLAAGEAAIEAYVPQVGSVFQNPKTQYFNVDTTAELAFPCENAGMEPQAIRRRVDEVVEQFQLGPLMDRSVFKLSGGEKQRVAFAAACMLGPRLLVLDEPTNHLDIMSKEILEDALNGYEGTILYVSHDRYFINRTAHRILDLTEGQFISYVGNYDYYLEKHDTVMAAIEANAPQNADADSGVAAKAAESEVKLDWKAQKEEQARLRKKENDLKKCEEKIAELEARISEIDTEMSDPAIGTQVAKLQELTKEQAACQEQLEKLYEQWEELAE